MNRNLLYVLIIGFAVLSGVLAYQVYRDRQSAQGINIDIGKSGVTIQSH